MGNQGVCSGRARNGHTVRLQVYCGKNSSLSSTEPGLASRVVLELLDGLETISPKIYMDNYYTSPELFLALYKKKRSECLWVQLEHTENIIQRT